MDPEIWRVEGGMSKSLHKICRDLNCKILLKQGFYHIEELLFLLPREVVCENKQTNKHFLSFSLIYLTIIDILDEIIDWFQLLYVQ